MKLGRDDQGAVAGKNRYKVIPRTLCFVLHGAEVLLLLGGSHKRLWAGLYNGLGGHVEAGEDICSSTLREVREECGLEVHELRLRGIVHAETSETALGVLFFVFTAAAPGRDTQPTDEGVLEWFPVDDLPLDRMVEDLPTLLPRVLKMQASDPPFYAAYHYDDQDRLQIHFAAAS